MSQDGGRAVSAADVLESDFKASLSGIDFSKAYDPFGKAFEKACMIGQMWMAARQIEDDVSEELDGARTYWSAYVETSDAAYKEMAADELRHAGILIKKHLAKETDENRRKLLNDKEMERQELSKQMMTKTE